MTEQNAGGREEPGPTGDREDTPPVNTGKKQRSGRFKPGRSGNPKGRPRGRRNKVTAAIERIVLDEAEDIVRALVDAAKNGNTQAAIATTRLIIGPMRERSVPVKFCLPDLKQPADAVAAMSAIAGGVANGVLTPDDAKALAAVVDAFVKAVEAHDHASRLETIEATIKMGSKNEGH